MPPNRLCLHVFAVALLACIASDENECKECIESFCLPCSSDNQSRCGAFSMKQHRLETTYFYFVRVGLDEHDAGSYEDPHFSYPEKDALSSLILEDIETFSFMCPEATLVELLLDTERHLSLLALTSVGEEIVGNISNACLQWKTYRGLAGASWVQVAVGAALVATATSHLQRTWHRLGLDPEQLCTKIKTEEGISHTAIAAEILNAETHKKCQLQGHRCRSHTFLEVARHHLPSLGFSALMDRATSPQHSLGSSVFAPSNESCRAQEAVESWRRLGGGLYAKTCSAPFLTYWPYPVPTITRCKYCVAASFLNLRIGDSVLDFGAGCGFGAAWLGSAFGVRVTVVDAFGSHVEAANGIARIADSDLAGVYVGDVAALAAFPDGAFDAVLTNSALQISRPFALQCAVLRAHFVRLLRTGGALWWGDLNNPHNALEFRGSPAEWHACLRPLAEASLVSYCIVPELELFGATEAWDRETFSLFVVRLPLAPSASHMRPTLHAAGSLLAPLPSEATSHGAAYFADVETLRMSNIYRCPAALRQGLVPPPEAEAVLASVEAIVKPLNMSEWVSVAPFEPGPSFWACTEARLSAHISESVAPAMTSSQSAEQLGPRLWAVDGFVSNVEVSYLMNITGSWFFDAASKIDKAHQSNKSLWVDDIIVPTGIDAVLDALEDRLEDGLGMPRSHSDPWHVLRYEAGYAGHWPHTDCHHPGYDPNNDRLATALVWLSIPSNCSTTGNEEIADSTMADGATVFPRYGVRVQREIGGLVLYSSFGSGSNGECDPSSLHYAAPVASCSRVPKVVLQKWYYAWPVEPSSISTPVSKCNERQCKYFMMAPETRSLEIQTGTASLEAAIEQAMTSAEAVLGIVQSPLLDSLRDNVENEVSGASLGRSSHARAMYLVANWEIIGWQMGVGDARMRQRALDRLRSALRRCPVCEDMLSLIARVLSDEAGVSAAMAATKAEVESRSSSDGKHVHTPETGQDPSLLIHKLALSAVEREAHEALAYARRLAAIGSVGAATLARDVTERLRLEQHVH